RRRSRHRRRTPPLRKREKALSNKADRSVSQRRSSNQHPGHGKDRQDDETYAYEDDHFERGRDHRQCAYGEEDAPTQASKGALGAQPHAWMLRPEHCERMLRSRRTLLATTCCKVLTAID